MDRYFTVMVIPEREKNVKSFRIPRIIFRALIFVFVLICILVGIFIYDYSKVLKQVYENKHLSIENRELKEQIQLFQMKMNSMSENIERISVFEKKLRVITGLENTDLSTPFYNNIPKSMSTLPKEEDNDNSNSLVPQKNVPAQEIQQPQKQEDSSQKKNDSKLESTFIPGHLTPEELDDLIEDSDEYQKLKKQYEGKIATSFGLHTGYSYTQEWSYLTRTSFSIASQFARIDYQFSLLENSITDLEINVHALDQYLLDKDSYLKSTPTLLPTRGWITSYYGPRMSPYSGRVKMHEGLDVGGNIGTPIVAPADGIVTMVGEKPGYGIMLKIDHGYGIETIFAHTNEANVKKGEKIKRGEMIAHVGNTGYSTGPHLHYEIRVNGTPVDPLYFILD